jgi:hypothetical protein
MPRETNSSQSASMTSVALSFRATRMARRGLDEVAEWQNQPLDAS